MSKKTFICFEHTNKCNLNCWYCSNRKKSNDSVSEFDIEKIYRQYENPSLLLIGGESLTLPTYYYMNLLNKGVKFSIQTNLTLYNEEWDQVFTHKNFEGLSVSGDKFESKEKFYEKYFQVSKLLNHNPQVLLLVKDEYSKSIDEMLSWVEDARKYKFTV